MKLAAISGAVIAALAAGSVATPTFAQDYRGYGYYDSGRDPCQQKKHDSGTTGAVLGGIAGALLGSSLASHHDGRTGGALIGAVAGAALGNNIGRSSAHSSATCDGYVRQGYYGGRSYDSAYYRASDRNYGYYATPYRYDQRYDQRYRYDDRRY